MYKLENTLENKARFFALYWGQTVQMYKVGRNAPYSRNEVNGLKKGLGYLELNPLSQISDEDALELSKIHLNSLDLDDYEFKIVDVVIHVKKYDRISFTYRWRDRYGDILSENILIHKKGAFYFVDYLRSRGYALPLMGLSIDDLVSYGWVKLKGGSDE